MTSMAVLSLVCFSVLISSLHAKECDPDLRFKGKQYKEVVVAKLNAKTTELVVSPVSGDVFFNEATEDNKYKVKRLKAGESVAETVHGLKYTPHGITIDEDNDVVYIGAVGGIYKIDKESNKAVLWNAFGVDITSVYHRNGVLYFITEDDFRPRKYVLEGGEYIRYDIDIEYADGFFVDRVGNFFYLDKNDVLMKRAHDSDKSVVIAGLPKEEPTALTITPENDVLVAVGKKTYVIADGENVAKRHNDYDSTVEAFYMTKNGVLYAADEHNLLKYVLDPTCKI